MLPPFAPAEFLEMVRGRHVAFVGDSLARNQCESLVCLLSSEFPVELVQDGGEERKFRRRTRWPEVKAAAGEPARGRARAARGAEDELQLAPLLLIQLLLASATIPIDFQLATIPIDPGAAPAGQGRRGEKRKKYRENRIFLGLTRICRFSVLFYGLCSAPALFRTENAFSGD